MFTLSEFDFSQFIKALQFAAEKHKAQKRKDGVIPYINHPIEVTRILWETGGVRDISTLLAALLHDTVEDTNTSPAELREHFGEDVMGLVLEMSDDKSLPKPERKRLQVEHAPHKSPRARQIKLADKITNIQNLIRYPPIDWSLERKREYLDWSKRVIDGLRGHNPDLEAAYDQALAEARAALA